MGKKKMHLDYFIVFIFVYFFIYGQHKAIVIRLFFNLNIIHVCICIKNLEILTNHYIYIKYMDF